MIQMLLGLLSLTVHVECRKRHADAKYLKQCLPPEPATGISPADLDLRYLPLDTCRMLWLIFTAAIGNLFVVIGMTSRGDVNEGSEMEKGRKSRS